MNDLVKGHIIFDHDGTLVKVSHDGLILFDGMKELLNELLKENYKLYVWTARSRSSTLKGLNSFEIASMFTDFHCHDDGLPKPHPYGPAKMLSGVDKKNVIHIGDSIGDFEGANNFGIDFIYASWNDAHYGEQMKSIADVAFTISDCKALIDKKFNR